jgi:hypothetical protein
VTTPPRAASSAVARAALQVQHPFLCQIRERVAYLGRQAALAGKRFSTLTMNLVPRSAVVFGRFHQASSE